MTPPSRIQLRKNDQVKVIAGKSLNKVGRVLRVLRDKNRIIVEGVSFLKRHTRANPSKNIKGGIVERESPIHISNVMIICASCGKPTRIGHMILSDGKKIRVCRKCGGSLDK
ncbi:MAG: 50S ribosomal protein L24 [Acidobacteria bacterium]|nr:MAG: 50S ribosomal protein L24 [Acidobacteriota bacterium]